jgi:hypothetical protein
MLGNYNCTIVSQGSEPTNSYVFSMKVSSYNWDIPGKKRGVPETSCGWFLLDITRSTIRDNKR